MKNVTIALDDETHRKARIRAAEMGTSLSALVKSYLSSLSESDDRVSTSVIRETAMPFAHMPAVLPATDTFVPLAKPRQPGALRGMWVAEDFDATPDWLLDAFEGKDGDQPWPGLE